MKIYYVPLDARWLERIRKEATELRQVQRDLALTPLILEQREEVLRIISTCSGELETIRWSAFNHDVVVKEGAPPLASGEERSPPPMPFLLDWFEFARMLYEQDDDGQTFDIRRTEWTEQMPPDVQQIWANRAERSVCAFTFLLPPDMQERLGLMLSEERDGGE
jgi:hypothetical protein